MEAFEAAMWDEPPSALMARLMSPALYGQRPLEGPDYNPDHPWKFCLLNVCAKGYRDVAWGLLKLGADPNVADSGGRTPLQCASFDDSANGIIELLLAHDADGNKVDIIKGETSLYQASREGAVGAVTLLLKYGVDADKADKAERTPLFAACLLGRAYGQSKPADFLKIVELLLDHGVDTDKAGNDGRNPLFAACQYGNAEIALALCRAKATLGNISKLKGRVADLTDDEKTQFWPTFEIASKAAGLPSNQVESVKHYADMVGYDSAH